MQEIPDHLFTTLIFVSKIFTNNDTTTRCISFVNVWSHWRRQLWGTGARAPLDFQLVILGITRFTDSDESCARFSSRAFSGHRFCRGKFILSFFAPGFPRGLIIVPKMPERSPINFNSTRTSGSGKTGC